MILKCNYSGSAGSHRFIFLEGGPARDVPPTGTQARVEGAGKETLRKGELPAKESPEAHANERKKLTERHGKITQRIAGADKKLQKCSSILSNFLDGSELGKKAKAAYHEAEKTLTRVKANLPKINVVAVIAKLSAAAKDVPEMDNWKFQLAGSGLSAGIAEQILAKPRDEIAATMATITEWRGSATSQDFAKMIESINKTGQFDMATIRPQLPKLSYYFRLQQGLDAIGHAGFSDDASNDFKDRTAFYNQEQNVNVVLDFCKKTRELSLPLADRATLFQIEKNPERAVALVNQAEFLAAQKGIKVTDALKVFSDQAKAFAKAEGISEADALFVCEANSKPGFQDYFKKFKNHGDLKNPRTGKVDAGSVALLMALIPRYDEKNPDYKGLIASKMVSDGSPAALKYIIDLQGLGLTPQQIVSSWEVSKNAQDIRDIQDLKVKLPELDKQLGHLPKTFLPIGRFFLTQKPEIHPFLMDAIIHTTTVSVPELKIFTEDPSLPIAIDISRKLKNYQDVSPQASLRLARSLYLQGIRDSSQISEDDLVSKMNELKDFSKSVANIDLYKGREVIFVAGNDVVRGTGEPKFHSPAILEQLSKSVGKKVEPENAGPTPTPEELVALKNKIIKRMKDAPCPMTMCFSGHGDSSMGLSLDMSTRVAAEGKYKYDPASYLSLFEMANVIKFRSDKFNNASSSPDKKDIYIFSACDSDRIVRRISGIVTAQGGTQPSFVSCGNYGFRAWDGEERQAMQLGNSNAKMGNIQRSNLTMYAANKQGELQQTLPAG